MRRTPDERWREKEKGRRKKAKERPVEIKLDPVAFPKTTAALSGIKLAAYEVVNISLPALEPHKKSKLEQVMDSLVSLRVAIGDLRVWGGAGSFGRADVGVKARVMPLPGTAPYTTRDAQGNIQLYGNSVIVDDPIEAVRCARRFLIELCTHEIDEHLYHAGLGRNPHDWIDGIVPSEEIGKLHERFGP